MEDEPAVACSFAPCVPFVEGMWSEEEEGLPDEGLGVTKEIDEEVDAVDRLRALGSSVCLYEYTVDVPLTAFAEYNDLATDVSIDGGAMAELKCEKGMAVRDPRSLILKTRYSSESLDKFGFEK